MERCAHAQPGEPSWIDFLIKEETNEIPRRLEIPNLPHDGIHAIIGTEKVTIDERNDCSEILWRDEWWGW